MGLRWLNYSVGEIWGWKFASFTYSQSTFVELFLMVSENISKGAECRVCPESKFKIVLYTKS